MLKVLALITMLCLCKNISVLRKYTVKYLRIEDHHVYVHKYIHISVYRGEVEAGQRRREEKVKVSMINESG